MPRARPLTMVKPRAAKLRAKCAARCDPSGVGLRVPTTGSRPRVFAAAILLCTYSRGGGLRSRARGTGRRASSYCYQAYASALPFLHARFKGRKRIEEFSRSMPLVRASGAPAPSDLPPAPGRRPRGSQRHGRGAASRRPPARALAPAGPTRGPLLPYPSRSCAAPPRQVAHASSRCERITERNSLTSRGAWSAMKPLTSSCRSGSAATPAAQLVTIATEA